MSTPQSPPPPAAPPSSPLGSSAAGLFNRLSLGGKLMLGGAALSILAFVFKAYGSSAHANLGELGKNLPFGGTGFSQSSSILMFETWHGVVAVLGCLATGVLAFLLYSERTPAKAKELGFAALGASGAALLVSVILLLTLSKNSSGGFSGPGVEISAGPGLGAYLMIVAAGVCLAGSVMHARSAKLF